MKADIDMNGDVNFVDFACLANYWMDTNCDVADDYCEGADYGQDGDVDVYDMFVLAYSWLND